MTGPIRVKGWAKFQHFKDRKPPWIKLYRDLLDDKEWHRLDAKAAKALVMFWLIASENDGDLPDRETLAFRLRTTETEVDSSISKLSHWLEHCDNSVISGRHQPDAPETETETETERKAPDGFDDFWAIYPNRKAKQDAFKAWSKLKPNAELQVSILKAIAEQCQGEDWRKEGGRFVPHAATWLNGKRWLDEGRSNAPQMALVGDV